MFPQNLKDPSNSTTVIAASIGASIAILMTLLTILVITVALIWIYKRRSSKQKLYTILHSAEALENKYNIQPDPIQQQDSPQIYDEIHFNPFTGQTKYIPQTVKLQIISIISLFLSHILNSWR